MLAPSRRARRSLCAFGALVTIGLCAAPSASAELSWEPCGDAPGVQCATQTVPLDYDRPQGRTLDVAVARVAAKNPAQRIGPLFFNFGGPGGPTVDFLQATAGEGLFDALNERFDLIAMDPRGTGQTERAIDCDVNQETEGLYSQPFVTPLTVDLDALAAKVRRYGARCERLNGDILEHVSTADVARDMDVIRASLGEDRLSYLGFSYGTFLGATYASLFPGNYRGLVLDGAVDADSYINHPLVGTRVQTAAFERALQRFFQACAADQTTCAGFGGSDPHDAFDVLAEQADATPIPAAGYTPDPRAVDGDDLRAAASSVVYSKQLWPVLAIALATAQGGDGSLVRQIVDELFYGRDPVTGEYDPFGDRFPAINAAEARWPTSVDAYARAGRNSWQMFDHFWFNHGYSDLTFGLWPARAQDVFYGPFEARASGPTVLVVGTTYDPATPYRDAILLTRDLGDARLLTMRGDGHTAYGGNSACIDAAVNAYLLERSVPAVGTTCRQEVPFALPEELAGAAPGLAARRATMSRLLGPLRNRRAIVR